MNADSVNDRSRLLLTWTLIKDIGSLSRSPVRIVNIDSFKLHLGASNFTAVSLPVC